MASNNKHLTQLINKIFDEKTPLNGAFKYYDRYYVTLKTESRNDYDKNSILCVDILDLKTRVNIAHFKTDFKLMETIFYVTSEKCKKSLIINAIHSIYSPLNKCMYFFDWNYGRKDYIYVNTDWRRFLTDCNRQA